MSQISLVIILLSIQYILLCASQFWDDLKLPKEHIPYYFYNNLAIRKRCQEDTDCPYKEETTYQKCWGHEEKCPSRLRMLHPECPGDGAKAWAKTKEAQLHMFWEQADFGYVKKHLNALTVYCQPQTEEDSYLACTDNCRYCRATNIMIDLNDLQSNTLGRSKRYREDVFSEGQIGGHCSFDKENFLTQGAHKSPLQSWFAELEQYTELDYNPITENKCDIVIDKPTFLIKLDAGVNMYHHFCDYINLYASQHMNNSFSTDVNIVMWDTSPMHYGDFFHDTWKAFTDHPIIHLKDYDGKKVCFKDAVFSLLARMRYGLYYNMPLIPSCRKSSLFRAFSQHILHRLHIKQEGPLRDKVRITLLSRKSKYRNIMNQDALVDALKAVKEYDVKLVTYNHHMPFLEQLKLTYNSDVFIGMHGAGLTHMLFQPDWATIFELYNCEDRDCYSDLARLRGLNYLTWERRDKLDQEDEGHHPTLGAHAKFTNYAFNVEEFLRKVAQGADHVVNHASYRAAWEEKYGQESSQKDEL